jgi:serine protease Do
VPINSVSVLLENRAAKAALDLVVRPAQVRIAGSERGGLIVLEVLKHGAAEAASLMLGDILVGVDGRALDSLEDFERTLEGAGERVVRLQFLRGDRANVRTVAVRLGSPNLVAA